MLKYIDVFDWLGVQMWALYVRCYIYRIVWTNLEYVHFLSTLKYDRVQVSLSQTLWLIFFFFGVNRMVMIIDLSRLINCRVCSIRTILAIGTTLILHQWTICTSPSLLTSKTRSIEICHNLIHKMKHTHTHTHTRKHTCSEIVN